MLYKTSATRRTRIQLQRWDPTKLNRAWPDIGRILCQYQRWRFTTPTRVVSGKQWETIYNFGYPLIVLPIWTEPVISNIFVAVLYLCIHTRIKGQWGQWRWELKKLAQYAMIPATTLHIICEKLFLTRRDYGHEPNSFRRPRVYGTVATSARPLVTAQRMMFLLPRRHYKVMKIWKMSHSPRSLCVGLSR